MALRETDLVFGPARRKIETETRMARGKTVCWVDGGTICGEHLATVLSGFLIKQVGDDGFIVTCSDGKTNVLL